MSDFLNQRDNTIEIFFQKKMGLCHLRAMLANPSADTVESNTLFLNYFLINLLFLKQIILLWKIKCYYQDKFRSSAMELALVFVFEWKDFVVPKVASTSGVTVYNCYFGIFK